MNYPIADQIDDIISALFDLDASHELSTDERLTLGNSISLLKTFHSGLCKAEKVSVEPDAPEVSDEASLPSDEYSVYGLLIDVISDLVEQNATLSRRLFQVSYPYLHNPNNGGDTVAFP